MADTKPKGRSRCVSRRGILLLVAALTLLCLLKPLEIYSGHKAERDYFTRQWKWLGLKPGFGAIPRLPFPGGSGNSVKTDDTGLCLLLAQHASAFGRRARASLCSRLRSTRRSTSEFKAWGCPADNVCPGIGSSVSEPGTYDHRSAKVGILGVSSSPAVRNHSYSQTHWQLEWIT